MPAKEFPGTGVRLSAPGVYDPEKQLSPDGIVALKNKLNNDEPWRELRSAVCTHIVMGMLADEWRQEQEEREQPATSGEEDTSYLCETAEDFARRVGELSAQWALGLQKAIALPGSEWPEGMTPPATYAEALKEVEARKAQEKEQAARELEEAEREIEGHNSQIRE